MKPDKIGVVGTGLMGNSIVVSLLLAGHDVVAVAPLPGEKDTARTAIEKLLSGAIEEYAPELSWSACSTRLTVTESYTDLADCCMVQECVIEDMAIKQKVFSLIEAQVDKHCILSSNTSAIPISTLQGYVRYPERFLGIHWAEPAFATRFLEITRGDLTAEQYVDATVALAAKWNKEPTVLQKDIRGFITNRLMYAVYREALGLIDLGHTTLEDVDQLFQYDLGSWSTFMGPFRRMDYVGIDYYLPILKRLFNELQTYSHVPQVMQDAVTAHKRGVHNNDGLYTYQPGEADAWQYAFEQFNKEIYRLAIKYPEQF